jgi:toxin ParE1/3/4
MRLVWSPLALTQVRDIARYIAKDKPSAAQKWVQRLFAAVERLPDQPLACRVVPELNRPDIREFIFGNYRVIYRLRNGLQVLVVRHGRQLLDETTELVISEP